MRLRVHHEIRFSFEPAAKSATQCLRLNPRNHEGQHVASWRVSVDADCRLKAAEDSFGNLTHVFTCGPREAIRIDVAGEVETFDTAGVLRGTVERLAPEFYLRDTALTAADAALRAFAEETAAMPDPLGRLHALLAAVHAKIAMAEEEGVLGAAQAFGRGLGGAADLAHVFIAAARHAGIPARFIAGYCLSPDARRLAAQSCGASVHLAPAHAWAEAFVPGLGWIGFDPASGLCPQEQHVRVAVGLDHLGAAPVRAASYGGASVRGDADARVNQV